MQIKWMHAIAVVAVFAVPCFAAAQAPSAPAQPQSAPTKALAGTAVNSFDFSGSFLKTFSTSTTGNGTVADPHRFLRRHGGHPLHSRTMEGCGDHVLL